MDSEKISSSTFTSKQLTAVSANFWTRPATALLIEMYKRLECLWKTNSSYYRNKNKRQEALQEIATALAPFRRDTTIEDVKNKINGIRTQYVAEKNKVNFYANSNPPTEYEPTLWCYDRLSFLESFTSLKTLNKTVDANTSNDSPPPQNVEGVTYTEVQIKTEDFTDAEIIESININANEENEDHYSIQFDASANLRKRPRGSVEDAGIFGDELVLQENPSAKKMKTYSRASLSTEAIEKKGKEVSDSWIDIFGKFVSSQMKLINNKTLLIRLQHNIQNALMEAQLEQFELDNRS